MKKLCRMFSCVCGLLAISSTFSVNVFAGPVVRGFDIETGIYVSTNKPYNPRGYDMDGYKIKYIPDANNPWDDDDPRYGAFLGGLRFFCSTANMILKMVTQGAALIVIVYTRIRERCMTLMAMT